MTIEADTRNLAKWLNEEQTAPIDRQALARVLAHLHGYSEKGEPVAYRCWNNPKNADGAFDSVRIWLSTKPDGYENEPLYTAPPQRKPLTHELIEKCMKRAYEKVQGRNLEYAFAREVEAAHGITGESK